MVGLMTSTFGFTPGQPPEWDIERFMRGDEVDTAVITLERNRLTFAWKCADVDAEGLGLRLGASSVTLGGLLKHLAWVEELYFQNRLAGRQSMAPFDQLDLERDWEDWAWTYGGRRHPRCPACALGRDRAPLPRRAGRGAVPRWAGADDPRRDEPAPVAGRHDRGVRPPHRARRPAPRASRRGYWRRRSEGLPGALKPHGLTSASWVLTGVVPSP